MSIENGLFLMNGHSPSRKVFVIICQLGPRPLSAEPLWVYPTSAVQLFNTESSICPLPFHPSLRGFLASFSPNKFLYSLSSSLLFYKDRQSQCHYHLLTAIKTLLPLLITSIGISSGLIPVSPFRHTHTELCFEMIH
jgi:hypothetical protein